MVKKFRIIVLILLVNTCNIGFAQDEEKLFFIRNTNIPVKIGDEPLQYPWVGGLNNPQLFNFDLNMDGVEDLVIFERSDNQFLTFLSNNKEGEVNFTYAPEYEHLFPKSENWCLLVDYDGDGMKDLFSHVPSGIRAFKNISTKDRIAFKAKEYRLESYNPVNGNPAKIAVSGQDIPAMGDVDFDGDMDILTFGSVGRHIEYHENQCKDKGKDCKDFDFSMVTRCWGNFAENDSNNGVVLNAPCLWDSVEQKNFNNFHVGSTLLLWDIDGDKDNDLIVGDNSSRNLVLLTNGGDKDTCKITAADPKFPSKEEPADIDIFPATFKLDLNNDKILDLVAAVNTQNFENRESAWYYENEGTNENPKFKLKSKNIIQNQMIEVGYNSFPTFFDYNNDGLLDILVSSYNFYTNDGNTKSKIYYFENVGSKTEPAFKFITDDWEDLYKDMKDILGQSLQTTFGDMDDDGDADMFIGNEEGELFYFENKAASKDAPADFEGTGEIYLDTDGKKMDVGVRSSPELFDLNEDGLLDLIIGERNGNLNYYENQGTKTEPKFKLINDKLGGVNLNANEDPTSGKATPKFFVRNGKIELFVGSEYGSLYYYDNISDNLGGNFNLVDSAYQNIQKGYDMTPDLADMNDDGFPDLVFGSNGGGLRLYLGAKFTGIEEVNKDLLQLRLYPNPTNSSIRLSFNNENSSDKFQVIITDVMGKTMVHQTIFNQDDILLDISHYAKGIYFVSLQNKEIQQTSRFVKGD